MTCLLSKIAKYLLIFFCLFLNNIISFSATSYEELRSDLIVKFAKYIKWPDENKFQTFNICVYGKDSLSFNSLCLSFENVKIEKSYIKISYNNYIKVSDSVNMLFVDKSFSDSVENLSYLIDTNNILLVSEQCADRQYVMLNILIKENNTDILFEINKSNIVISNLVISPELFLLGGKEINLNLLYNELHRKLEEENKNIGHYKKSIYNLSKNSDVDVQEDSITLKIKEQENKIISQKRVLLFTVIISLILFAFVFTLLRLNSANKRVNKQLQLNNKLANSKNEQLEDTLDKLKKAQAQLVHSEKMASLGVLISGIAHEINNPINFISSGIIGLKSNIDNLTSITNDLINSENKNNYNFLLEVIQKMFVNMEVGVKRSMDIVKSLSSIARSDQKRVSNFNIHDNINNTLLLLYNKYKGRIDIDQKYANNIPLIECVHSQINQVFLNVLSNSIQAIDGKGLVTIKTLKDTTKNQICISIADSGVGISDKVKAYIFDPFYTTKEVGKGTGLGLSISYEIINNHNGKIEVESRPGFGSEFKIYLPIYH